MGTDWMIMIYVGAGCIQDVAAYPTLDEALVEANKVEIHDPEGDDLAVYRADGELAARWYPQDNADDYKDWAAGYWRKFEMTEVDSNGGGE